MWYFQAFASNLARKHYQNKLQQKVWAAWHSVVESRWQQRVEKACQTRAEQVCIELTNDYETKLASVCITAIHILSCTSSFCFTAYFCRFTSGLAISAKRQHLGITGVDCLQAICLSYGPTNRVKAPNGDQSICASPGKSAFGPILS